jgi:hypothetical protein
MSIETEAAGAAIKAVASPILHYIYGGIIALLIGGFAWYTVHERDVGEAKIKAADAAHAAAIAKKDQTIADNAQLQLVEIGNHEKIALALPPVANTGLVCVAPSSPITPTVAASVGQPSEVPVVSSGSFDPSGGLLTLLRDDDTRINALADTVTALEQYIAAIKQANDGK